MDNTQELSGRELDRRVAELRGDVFGGEPYCPECTERPAIIQRIMQDCGLCGNALCWPPKLPPRYSENDALAAELRREMASFSMQVNLRTLQGVAICDVRELASDPPEAHAKGTTEAEATARAYVYWKEQTAKAVEEE